MGMDSKARELLTLSLEFDGPLSCPRPTLTAINSRGFTALEAK